MATPARIRLLDADPDVGRYLTPEERGQAAALTVPVMEVATGPLEAGSLLAGQNAFGAFVIDGMLAAHMRVGEQSGMRILGPGDILSPAAAAPSMLLADRGIRVVATAHLAMLGRDVLVGAHRWPRLLAGLHARAAEQIERVAVQLAICQLPRVEDRLLALLWLLAENWGRVTSAGTVLPITLTHETLGALVGARRPTVTLALGELADRGAVVRQGRAWLLTERPGAPSGASREPHAPELVLDGDGSPWGVREEETRPQHEQHDDIIATVRRLEAEHAERTTRIETGLSEMREARRRNNELRERLRADRLSRRPAPS
jgi:CRP-like cAMP-binding protein